MQQYLDLLKDIIINGEVRQDRTGTGTKSVFFRTFRHDLNTGFPLLTTKKIFFKGIVGELLWFLRGDININFLLRNNITIWNEWTDEYNNVGPMYGYQWVDWGGIQINQIQEVINSIKTNPTSRRHVISAWNVEQLPDETQSPQDNVRSGKMALAPCHYAFQFYVNNKNQLSCVFHMRSCDVFLGLPFNIASYSLLTHMIAHHCDLKVGEICCTLGDCHLYLNHLTDDIVFEQIKREPCQLPQLKLVNPPNNIFEYDFENFKLINYTPQPTISAPISV